MRLDSTHALTLGYLLALTLIAFLSFAAYIMLTLVILCGRQLIQLNKTSDQQQLSAQRIVNLTLLLTLPGSSAEHEQDRVLIKEESDNLEKEEDDFVQKLKSETGLIPPI
jgi:uncharacterized protein (DUF58 family)